MKRDIAKEIYKFYRSGSRKLRGGQDEEVREKITDPTTLEVVLSEVIAGRNWGKGVAEGNLFSTWPQIVGQEIASHTNPISLVDGKLTIQSSSTAWATQLNLIAADLLATIQKDATGVLIERLAIIGPQTPTWKKGIRTIRNARGPRDTYN